jgi:hypothetical protein
MGGVGAPGRSIAARGQDEWNQRHLSGILQVISVHVFLKDPVSQLLTKI